MTRVAVLGGFGQLGSDVVRRLGERAIALGHADADLTDAAQLAARLETVGPDIVINCAAYNLVDRAEDEPHAALAVNAVGVRNLATWCRDRDVPLLHVSTDYVFGAEASRRTPHLETDTTGPVSVYGTSKLAGENAVRELCPRHWIVRTCGLYGRHAARGKGNFVETMLRLAEERPELRLVNDQRCTPTSTADLADALIALIESAPYGTYHATNSGDCTWYEFAQAIFAAAGLSPRVVPITSAEFAAKARRPDYSVLNCGKLAALGITLRPWTEAVAEYVRASH
ncbi:MAG: dTDP-4-dehydrorhamnose reductase [Planctomycetaceae bacterium]|nr:dTDP-4-dehydrorhamnose reductase [Planctomycetaceae bacterium]